VIYTERRFDGFRTFELSGQRLIIRGKRSFVSRFEFDIDLTQIDPLVSKIWTRPPHFNMGVIMIGIGVVLAGIIQMCLGDFNASAFAFFVLVVPGLGFCVTTLRLVEFAQFKTKSGTVSFDVARSGPSSSEFDSFVSELIRAIISDGRL